MPTLPNWHRVARVWSQASSRLRGVPGRQPLDCALLGAARQSDSALQQRCDRTGVVVNMMPSLSSPSLEPACTTSPLVIIVLTQTAGGMT